MKQTVDHWILPAVLSVLAAALLASPAEARRGPRCLAPNGTDDTEALQAALEGCSGGRNGCTVRLCEGVFKTAPLRVGDFRGTLRGAGLDETVLQALPDLEVNPNPAGYWRDDPLDPLLLPWPYLVQFVEGRGTVRDLAIEIPAPEEGQRPTQGWTEVDFVSYELAGAILVTGLAPERFEITRVGVAAGDDPESALETTLLSGIAIRGLLFDPAGDPTGFPVFPVSGRHRVSDCSFAGMLTGVSLGELGDADVTVRRSETRAFLAVDLLDADHSRVRVENNRWDVEALGFNAFLNIDGDPSLSNTVRISGNTGSIGSFFGLGQGIFFQDPLILPEPGDSRVIVYGNDLELGSETERAFSAIEIFGAGSLFVGRNTLRGTVDSVGIGIDQTTRCRVFLNDFGSLDPGAAAPDLHLGPETDQCLALLRRDDGFLDEGTNNRIFQLW